MSGRTLVHSRSHFRKRFDLCERVMAEAVAKEPLTREGFRRWHLQQSLRALGAASETDLRMYLTFPRVAVSERRQALRAALAAPGEVVEIEVDGERGRFFALAEDLPALAAAGRKRRPAAGAGLLSPFDSFLWHRDRTRHLFGFWRGSSRRAQRVHGYYSLPIFHDGRLVAGSTPRRTAPTSGSRSGPSASALVPSERQRAARRLVGTGRPGCRPRRRRRGAAVARYVRRRRGLDPRPRDAGGARPALGAR